MTINNYIRAFECLYQNYDMALSDGVLALKIFNDANISEQHKQLVWATLSELKYDTMKKQLKKLFREDLFSDPLNYTGSVEPLSKIIF